MNRRLPLVAAAALTLFVAAIVIAGGTARTDAPGASPEGPLRPGEAVVADPRPWDGVAWQQIRTRGFALEPGQYVGRVIEIDGGLLALGQGPNPRPNPDGLTSTLTTWRSGDGVTWHPVPVLAGVGPGSVSEGWHAAGGPGGVVIAGNVCCREEGPAVWWSHDGASWLRAAFPRLGETYLTGAAAGGDGFVVIGTSRGEGLIWTSSDGLEWQPVDREAAGLVRGELTTVVAAGNGFVVGGMDDRADRNSDAAIWASHGLAEWRRLAADDPALAGDDEASIQRLVPFANGLFAIGGTGTQQDREACERGPEGGVLTAGPATGFSCGWLREMNWLSPDGTTWRRIDPWGPDGTYPPEPVPPTNRAPAAWDQVVAAGPGLAGVMVELVDGQAGALGDVRGVWTSADGASWRRIADGPPGDTMIVGTVVLDRRLYVMGEQGSAWLGTVLP